MVNEVYEIKGTPTICQTEANAELTARKKRGYEAGRIEFSVVKQGVMAINILFKKANFPRHLQVSISASQWNGQAARNHPVLYLQDLYDTPYYCGIIEIPDKP